jgi:hypothetical protein
MMTTMRAGAAYAFFGLLAGFAPQQASAADDAAPLLRLAKFEHERASHDVRYVANWVLHSDDNRTGHDHGLPFVILDKKDARIYVFDGSGRLRGAAPALLGMGIGDTALPGIGARELSNIAPKDRVTQAGRFVASLGADTHGEQVLWLNYEDGLAIHRVVTANPKERRLHRLATPTPLDNRISWGCINIPAKFFENVVLTTFNETKGIVYVLPETKPITKYFASYDVEEQARKLLALQPDPDRGAGGN